MATFESKVNIERSISDVYRFLSDFNNHIKLMPDNIQNWASTADEASFDIQNMAKLSLKITERVENKSIKILPIEKPPFEVEIKWVLSPTNSSTEVLFTLSANLNMMMKMMAARPLQKLADNQTQALAKTLTA
jgi:carbon monoxide dehydrogenase subunit G